MSETATCREELAPYCLGIGIDVGYGGDKIVPHAWAFDFPSGSYGAVGQEPQQLRGDCRRLPFICDNALDFVYSSHVLEDFSYVDLVQIISEWRRVLRAGGNLVINCPDQQRFLAHCEKTGQPLNLAHFEQDFSLDNFKSKVLNATGQWETVFEKSFHGPYSWLLVIRKV